MKDELEKAALKTLQQMVGDGIGVTSHFFSILFLSLGRASNEYEMVATTQYQ